MRRDVFTTIALLAFAAAGTTSAADGPALSAEVGRTLDAFHGAAAAADEVAYLGAFAADGVFIGTAPGERWTLEEFGAFVRPYFGRGVGWTYVPRAGGRHVGVADDGTYAWFDEVLDNEKYGECRGSGILRRVDGAWRIVQYELVIPIPNDIAADVVQRIREFRQSPADGDD